MRNNPRTINQKNTEKTKQTKEFKMNTNEQNQKKLETFRFKILKGEKQSDGKIEKTHQAGVATLIEGQRNYTVYIYMLQKEQFFLVPHKQNAERYYIMTRQPSNNPNKKSKYNWNIVGNAIANASQSCIELNFDLIAVPLFMSIFPIENRSVLEIKTAA